MSEQKYYRTLVRYICASKDGLWLCVPTWNSEIAVLRVFPSEIEEKIKTHHRFHAEVNLNTEFADSLHFNNFEFE